MRRTSRLQYDTLSQRAHCLSLAPVSMRASQSGSAHAMPALRSATHAEQSVQAPLGARRRPRCSGPAAAAGGAGAHSAARRRAASSGGAAASTAAREQTQRSVAPGACGLSKRHVTRLTSGSKLASSPAVFAAPSMYPSSFADSTNAPSGSNMGGHCWTPWSTPGKMPSHQPSKPQGAAARSIAQVAARCTTLCARRDAASTSTSSPESVASMRTLSSGASPSEIADRPLVRAITRMGADASPGGGASSSSAVTVNTSTS